MLGKQIIIIAVALIAIVFIGTLMLYTQGRLDFSIDEIKTNIGSENIENKTEAPSLLDESHEENNQDKEELTEDDQLQVTGEEEIFEEAEELKEEECLTDEDCPAEHQCVAGDCHVIACQPNCIDKECGSDGCGGVCGECYYITPCKDALCHHSGICVYANKANETPCDGGECFNGVCVCQPDCIDKECGSDGCGGVCGVCPSTHTCTGQGQCIIPVLDM